MVEQKAFLRLGRVFRQVPGSPAFADRIPGPDRIVIDAVHEAHLRLDLAVAGRDPYPVVVFDVERCPSTVTHIEAVAAVDLAQPSIHRAPTMIHRHRPLGDRVHREFGVIIGQIFKRLIPERQRVEERADALAMDLRRLRDTVAIRGQPELLKNFAVELG